MLRLAALLLCPFALRAQSPPTPVALKISPESISIFGLHSSQQTTVTAVFADGTEEDVTRQTSFATREPKLATVAADGIVHADAAGSTVLTASLGKRKVTATISVADHAGRPAVDFERDVIPVLTMMGCNGANCHGSMHGKAGFKLSQFGYEAKADYEMIVHNGDGHRVDLKNPESSLILRKPTMQIPHGGGKRFEKDSQQYQVLLDWLSAGAPAPKADAGNRIQRLEVFPSSRVLPHPGVDQQLVVRAHYSDGTIEDVTRRVKYVSLDDAVLQVDKEGLVHAAKPGEATILLRAAGATAATRLGVRVPGNEPAGSFPSESNFIDHQVFQKLRRMNVQPSGLAADAVFIRRVYLDTLGTLPPPDEVTRFLESRNPRKREELIDQVLARPEYSEYWGLLWADLLTVNAFKCGATDPDHVDLWIREQFRSNVPFDRFAHTLVAGTGPVRSDPGIGLVVGRTPEEAAGFYSQLFLGVRIQCAQCHDHPFEHWKRSDFYGTAAFFSQVAQKATKLGTVVYDNPGKELKSPITKSAVTAVIPGGAPAPADGRPLRQVFADWMTGGDNPFFAKAIVNRIWKHYLHVGLVEPVDDFRDTNPPSNGPLLDELASFFAKNRYDLKALMRLILNSTTYQLSSHPNKTNEFDTQLYSRYYYRRLPAEPLLDAIAQVTEARQTFRFGYAGMRAMQLQDSVIFDGFLQAFDRNRRERLCEREENHTLLQTLEMISGDTVNERIRNSPFVKRLAENGASDRSAIEEIFLRAFSRRPEPDELDSIESLLAASETRQQKFEDILWTALNSKEFIFNH
jgi:hypothetical protein